MLASLIKFDRSASMVVTVVTSMIPTLIVGGLLYAAFFVKAAAFVVAVNPPAIERRDAFMGVYKPTDKVIWAVGSNGKVVRSEDDGATWTAQVSHSVENLQGIAAWDADHAVAVGNDGSVIRTENGGKTWKEIQGVPKSVVANKLLNVRAYQGGSGWAVGEMGALLRTKDFGITWERAMPEKDQAWNDIAFAGNRGLVVGEFGQIARSDDGGTTWQPVKSGVSSSLMSVAMRDAENGIAVGLTGVVLVTRDGGKNWDAAERQTREHLNNAIWDGKQWIVVGDKGVLVTGDEGGKSWHATRVSEGNLGWNTQILSEPGRPNTYLLAGASLARLESGKYSIFGR